MKRFENGQRVRVTQCDDPRMNGYTGVVYRLRMADDMAWITMARDLPEGLASFPDGDARHRNIVMAPEECEPL